MRRISTQFLLLCLLAAPAWAQRNMGELRLQVVDASGGAVSASGSLVGLATQVNQALATGADGQQTVPALPFGRYRLTLAGSGFAPVSTSIEIRSEVPLVHRVTLGVAPIETTVRVTDADALLDPERSGAVQHIGADTLRDRRTALPARALSQLVDTQPGWLLEANGVLHPRGSEYQVQYVVDGLPLLDNRSPVFAPSLDIEEFQSLNIRTGGYPAEYGHQLGGVIEITTTRDARPGPHGKISAEGGSFATGNGAASLQFGHGRDTFGLSANAMRTDRYLDPPVEQNFRNFGSGTGVAARWDRDWNETDRTRLLVRRSRTGFLVPNEALQEAAGQRQDRTAEETSGQLGHTHLLSPSALITVQGMGRDVSAALWSNPLSTPIAPSQQRGFREAYGNVSLALHRSRHEWKLGTEALFRSVQEQFDYRIVAFRVSGVRIFDRDTPARFAFSDRRQNREQAAYLQDRMRFGPVSLSVGVRWDHYRLIADEHAISPRVAIGWQVPRAGLTLRASYDRAFQTPALENVLLASSAAVGALNDQGVRLPLRPSRGDFYEAGLAKSIGSHFRLDASAFRRNVRNFADDSLLLNTGVSFPIAFASGAVYGIEAKVELPRWGPLSGFVSYTNLLGRGRLPIAGGLFLEDDAAALLRSNDEFPISQDQRNTARTRFRYQAWPRLWLAAAAQYGSGLPVELDEGVNLPFLRQQYGPRVLDRVNLERGRVRPSFSVDLSAGADLWKHEAATVRLQADVFNVTDRLNVVNFAGLFSGTALQPGRWAAVRLQVEF